MLSALVVKPKVSWGQISGLVLILLSITFIFRATFSYFFAQDDFLFLSRLAHIQGGGDFLALFLRQDHFYRPMARVVMLGIPYALFATSPVGYHLFNLGLHLANSLLVYRLLRSLGSGLAGGWLGMSIYGLHPAHFTPLAWVSGIQELSVTFFVLLSALEFLAWLRSPNERWHYAISLISYAAALLSKEIAILLPVWLLVVSVMVQRSLPKSVAWKSIALRLMGFGLVAIGYLLLRSAKADVTGSSGPYVLDLNLQSVWSNLQLYALDLYGQRSADPATPILLLSLSFIAIIVLGTFLKSKRGQLAVGLIGAACFLIPSLALAGRHYSYYFSLPMVGIAVIFAVIGDRIGQIELNSRWLKSRQAGQVILSILLILWMVYVEIQIGQTGWDDQSLKRKGDWSRTVIADLAAQHPDFSTQSVLYVVGTQKGDEPLLGSGSLFTFFYPMLAEVKLDTLQPLTPTEQLHPDVYIFHLPPRN